MGRAVHPETPEARYEAFKRAERWLTEPGRMELWLKLSEDAHDEFPSISNQRKKRRALHRYALGIMGVVAAEAAGISCLVILVARKPHGNLAQLLVLAASILITLAWIPPWYRSRSARCDLLDEF